jgi:ATP citrate (pro-S)-lyase
MSAKAIRECDGKLLLAYWLLRSPSLIESDSFNSKFVPQTTKVAHVTFDTSILNEISIDNPLVAFSNHVQQTLNAIERAHPWLITDKLVVKPDQLIKRRGKSGLLLLNSDWNQVKEWIIEKAGKEIKVNETTTILRNSM